MFDTSFDDRFYTKLRCLGGEGLRASVWEAYIEARQEYLAERAYPAPVQVDAPRDPIVLSIRDMRDLPAINVEEPFLFEVGGKPYFFGSLHECMESRRAYAAGCEQNGVPYTITDLPEPHKSNLADFHANPVVGGMP
jgi:hypothetical protein